MAGISFSRARQGDYYGGSSWENQAFFDFEGHILDSISVFNPEYLKNGKMLYDILNDKDLSKNIKLDIY